MKVQIGFRGSRACGTVGLLCALGIAVLGATGCGDTPGSPQTFEAGVPSDAGADVPPSTDGQVVDAAPVSPPIVGANDVSVLFLGTKKGGAELASLLRLDQAGTLGALLPQARFDALVANMGTQYLEPEAFNDYASWVIVGMRIDPCVKVRAADSACSAEIRLIAQPTTRARSLTVGPFEDHAIHLVYGLSAGELAEAVKGLVALHQSTGARAFLDSPLGVHPLIARDGNAGPYATAMKSWILEHTGDARLRRIAANFSSSNLVWFLRSMEVQGSATVVAPVPCSPSPTQLWSFSSNTDRPDGPTLPIPNCAAETNLMMRTQTAARFQAATAAERATMTNEALELARPDRRMFGDVDCVACHETSQNLAAWHGAAFLLAADGNPARYTARPIPLEPLRAPSAPAVMRAFGYFGNAAFVSLRTATETAEVLRRLSQ